MLPIQRLNLMEDLKSELAALRIDQSSRAGGRARKGVWTSVVIVLLVAGVAGWYRTARAQAAAVKVGTVTAATGGAAAPGAVLNASGYVTARRRATVSSKVTGKVLEVNVEEGHPVKQGQVLARLDDTQPRAALAYAEAQLAATEKSAAEDQARLQEAEANLRRLTQLLKDRVVGQAELDTAQANVAALKARIAYAQQQVPVAERQVALRHADLQDTIVRAPFSGMAVTKDAQPGEMISPVSAGGGFTRTGICTIVDMSSLEIEVDVNEGYINRVRPSQRVDAVLDAYPDWRIPAHVIAVVPTADRQKATVKVRIGFNRLDARILPDMGVKVSFLRDEDPKTTGPASPRLLMPKSAARVVDGRTIVFVVHEDRIERRAVKVGMEDRDQIEVLSGLSGGERVVTDGPPSLKDGDKVKIQS